VGSSGELTEEQTECRESVLQMGSLRKCFRSVHRKSETVNTGFTYVQEHVGELAYGFQEHCSATGRVSRTVNPGIVVIAHLRKTQNRNTHDWVVGLKQKKEKRSKNMVLPTRRTSQQPGKHTTIKRSTSAPSMCPITFVMFPIVVSDSTATLLVCVCVCVCVCVRVCVCVCVCVCICA
jgi:hypothetical protein